MKWQILLILALMAGIAYAEGTPTYIPNQNINLGLHLRNTTNEVTGANCSIQLRNSSYDIKVNDIMKEITNGYYNYTYNTSQTGYYYCRENCTLGNSYTAATCDFIIAGDEKMSIAIGLLMLGAAFFFVWLGLNTDTKEHFGLKLFFMLLGSIIMVGAMYMAYRLSIDNGSSSSVQSILLTFFQVGLWGVILFFIYVFLYITFKSIMMFKEMKWR